MRLIIPLLLTVSLLNPIIAQYEFLDGFIKQEMEWENIPGISACVIKGGQIVWQNSYGFANIEQNIQVTDETLFTLASISKLVATTAIMQLYEQQQFDLDDDINNYLDFSVKNPSFPGSKITFKMLLQHRSSIFDPEEDMYDYFEIGDSPHSLGNFLKNLLSPEGTNYHANYYSPTYAPGQAIYYSNVGFSLVGYLVEKISGISYHQYCKENIFNPLCMSNTSFFFQDTGTENIAMPYQYKNNTHIPLGYYSIALYPSALLKSNIIELSRFLIMYTNRGEMDGVRILNESTINLITPYSFEEENLGWWNGTSWTYTFYFPNDEVWFHGGYMPGIRNRMNYYPDDSTGIIILTNGEGQYRYIEDTLAGHVSLFTTQQPDTLSCNQTSSIALNKRSISIYPNPANEKLFIDAPDNKEVELFNQFGTLVSKVKNQSQIDLSNVSKGIYFIKIKFKNRHIIKKIVKI